MTHQSVDDLNLSIHKWNIQTSGRGTISHPDSSWYFLGIPRYSIVEDLKEVLGSDWFFSADFVETYRRGAMDSLLDSDGREQAQSLLREFPLLLAEAWWHSSWAS